jgi:hypothetical protein
MSKLIIDTVAAKVTSLLSQQPDKEETPVDTPDWNEWSLVVSAIAVLMAIMIPFAQKKYEEWKAKISFKLYLKKYFGIILNMGTYDKLPYTVPSVTDPVRIELFLKDFINRMTEDYEKYKNTEQPRIAFILVFNVQSIYMAVQRFQLEIKGLNINNLYEQTLAYGHNLSKGELYDIYGIMLILENYHSITSFHDKFQKLKTTQRITRKDRAPELIVHNEVIKNQNEIFDDLKTVNKDYANVKEVIHATMIMINRIVKFYGKEKRYIQ